MDFDRELAELAEQIRERQQQLAYAREAMAQATRALDMLEEDQRKVRRMRDRALEARMSQDRDDRGSRAVSVDYAAFSGGSGGRPPVLVAEQTADRAGDGAPQIAVPALLPTETPLVPSPPAEGYGRRLRPDPKGRAPRGFAKEVIRIAHRSIAAAGRPLNRRAIMDDLERSEVPMPVKGAPQKVSKVLGRDPDLVSRKGRGYSLVPEALARELAAIAGEAKPSQTPDP